MLPKFKVHQRLPMSLTKEMRVFCLYTYVDAITKKAFFK